MPDGRARQAFRSALAMSAAGCLALGIVATALAPLGTFSHLEGAITQLCVTLPHVTSDVASVLLLVFVAGSLASGLLALAASATLELREQARTRRHRTTDADRRLRTAAAHLGVELARVRIVDLPVARCRGFVSPRVELGHGVLDQLDDEQLRVVLAHEWHHLTRRDPMRHVTLTLLSKLLMAFPIVAAAAGAWKREAEFAADDAAARATSPQAVARTLLAFAPVEHAGGHAVAFGTDAGIGTRAARQLGVATTARGVGRGALHRSIAVATAIASCVVVIAALPGM